MATSYSGGADVNAGAVDNDIGSIGVGGDQKDKTTKSLWFAPTAEPAPAPAPAPVLRSGDDAWKQILALLTGNANDSGLYALQQWGLAPSTATSIGDTWQPVFDREFGRIYGDNAMSEYITQDMLSDNNITDDEYQQALTRAQASLPDTFGNQALTAEQQRRRNSYTQGLDALGWNNSLNSSFGDTADDDIINNLIQQQYDPARAIIENQYKRGLFNPQGYNYALNQLDEQKAAGLSQLNTIGQQQRDSARSGVDSWIDDIYGQASGTRLGQTFDPNSYGDEFTNRVGTATSGLQNSISTAAPTIFDPELVQRNAGAVQGMTSRGSLLDTIAGRRQSNRTTNRGIGSTGAF